MSKHLCTGVDSAVYASDNGKKILKIYKHSLCIDEIRDYHKLQNALNEKGGFILEFAGEYEGQQYEGIEVEFLSLENTIREVKKTYLGVFNVSKVISRQKNIDKPGLDEIKTLNENKKKILQGIKEYIATHLDSYHRDDINSMNIKIGGVEQGKLKLTITDIGADIKDLLKRNNHPNLEELGKNT